jgi:cytidylate kinase
MIITISRQVGAGGSEIARQVADTLHLRLVDNELIDRVADRAGMPRAEVARREERAPGFLERLVRALSRSAPELQSQAPERLPEPEEASLVATTERVVAEIAAEGKVVLVGRAAPAVLAGAHDALHIKIVAPEATRIERLMRGDGIDAREAERRIRESDSNRARYHAHYYRRDWNDPANYHMVLNAGRLGLEGATALIVTQARTTWRGT